MNRSEKKDFVKKLKEELNSSSSVIVAHYSGLSVIETDNLRKLMRDNGAKFKITKNRLTKIALNDTQYETISDLFSGPTAIAYSDDPVAPAKLAVDFEKKNMKISKSLADLLKEKKIDKSKINFLASLPSVDEIRAMLIGLISKPAQNIASILQQPGSQLARLLNAQSEKLGKSN